MDLFDAAIFDLNIFDTGATTTVTSDDEDDAAIVLRLNMMSDEEIAAVYLYGWMRA